MCQRLPWLPRPDVSVCPKWHARIGSSVRHLKLRISKPASAPGRLALHFMKLSVHMNSLVDDGIQAGKPVPLVVLGTLKPLP